MSKFIVTRARATRLILLVLILIDARTIFADRSRTSGPNPVLQWNRVANEILPFEAGPVIDSRAMAILHAAIHDAVNGIERRYPPYTADVESPDASLEAAVATAAHDVLIALAPGQQDRIEKEYASTLEHVPDGRAQDLGVALGQAAARANLERLFPGLGHFTPFLIDVARHRLRGPDPLRSKRYARDLNFLKSVGSLNSTTRTADQTATSHFWFEPFPIWNDIASTVIERKQLDPWRAARILALANFALVDSGIACFEAKYRFRFCRPYTAIRRAGEDGNDRTDADPEWLPLLWTPPGMPLTFLIPPIPDYPSAAADTSAAVAEVLAAHLGDRVGFEVTSTTLPGVTRRFKSFRHAAREAAMSRVYGGIHLLHAVEDGYVQGKGIGREVSRKLPRVRR